MAHEFHLRGISIKHAVIMSFAILMENLVQLLWWLVAVCCTSLLCHLDTTVRHEGTLQRLIGLQTNYLLQLLSTLANIGSTISCQSWNNFCFHIKHTTLGTLLLLEFLQHSPKGVGSLSRFCQERLIAVVASVVVLNEVTKIHFTLPLVSLETSPFYFHHFRLSFIL